MICWRCGTDIPGETCPVCGCVQGTRRQPASEVGFALRYAYDKFGPQRVLTDHDTLRRCLSDLIPDERKLRQRLTAVLDTDLTDRLYTILRQGQQVDAGMYQMMAQGLQTACGLTAGQAQEALGYLLEMVGLENPAGRSPQPDIPVPPPGPEPPPPGYVPPREDYAPPRPQPNYVPPPPSYAPPVQDEVLAELKSVVIEDATHGVDGGIRWNRNTNRLVVRRSGVWFYLNPKRKKESAPPDPWQVIMGGEIFKVSENFFMGAIAFTIVLKNGVRYRISPVIPTVRKDEVMAAIAAIRGIIIE